jgi:hypothetical protein
LGYASAQTHVGVMEIKAKLGPLTAVVHSSLESRIEPYHRGDYPDLG